jgi:hypothetical protein
MSTGSQRYSRAGRHGEERQRHMAVSARLVVNAAVAALRKLVIAMMKDCKKSGMSYKL